MSLTDNRQLLANNLMLIETLIAEIRTSAGLTVPALDVAGNNREITKGKPKSNKALLKRQDAMHLASELGNSFLSFVNLKQ